jgi:hypothetical protein
MRRIRMESRVKKGWIQGITERKEKESNILC